MDDHPSMEEDPFASIRETCKISSSQENQLLAKPLFAGESPPVLDVSSSVEKSAGMAVSSVEDEQEEVASHETNKSADEEEKEKEKAYHDEKSPAEKAQKEVLVSPGGGPGPSSSKQQDPEEGQPNPNLGSVDILEIVQRRGLFAPRPRWWRPEGYAKEDQDPKPIGLEKRG